MTICGCWGGVRKESSLDVDEKDEMETSKHGDPECFDDVWARSQTTWVTTNDGADAKLEILRPMGGSPDSPMRVSPDFDGAEPRKSFMHETI